MGGVEVPQAPRGVGSLGCDRVKRGYPPPDWERVWGEDCAFYPCPVTSSLAPLAAMTTYLCCYQYNYWFHRSANTAAKFITRNYYNSDIRNCKNTNFNAIIDIMTFCTSAEDAFRQLTVHKLFSRLFRSSFLSVIVKLPPSTLVQSAVLRSHIVCPSVCL